MRPTTTLLLVMGRERRLPLLEALDGCDVEILLACDRQEAGLILQGHPEVSVLLTDTELPDGSWRDVLALAKEYGSRVGIVVCPPAGFRRRLWGEVLKAGAADRLAEPYRLEDVRRVVEAAAARSRVRSLPLAHASRSRGPHTPGAGAA